MTDLVVREHGTGAEPVIVLHGGPAAAGDLAPLAGRLGDRWHVLEPFQRTSGDRPLTDGETGLRVVELLAAATRSSAMRGQPVELGGLRKAS